MCGPLAVAGIGVAISAAGSIYSGMASKQAADSEAKQYEIQRVENATATSQASRDRFAEFSDLEGANQTAIAAGGFTSESFGVLGEDNRKVALEDATRIEDQGAVKDGRMRFAAGQAKARGKAAFMGGLINAAGTIASGAAGIMGEAGPGSLVGSVGKMRNGNSLPSFFSP